DCLIALSLYAGRRYLPLQATSSAGASRLDCVSASHGKIENMSRVAIVTGGTRGIGEAISTVLGDMGYTVAANYAGNEEKAKAFTQGTGIKAWRWDVGDHQACLDGCAQVAADLGPVDIVVNNAGITRDDVLAKMSFDDWNEVMRI